MPDDERERLKQRRRDEARLRRAMETPEQRQARLQARSGSKRRKRSNPRGNRSRSSNSSSGSGSGSENHNSMLGDVVEAPLNQPIHIHDSSGLVVTTTSHVSTPSTTAISTQEQDSLTWHPVTHSQPHLVPSLPIFPGCGLAEVRTSWIDYSLPMSRP